MKKIKSIIALVICGIGEYIWYNPRVLLIFWLLCAISVSAKRSAEDEAERYMEFGELKDYYELS